MADADERMEEEVAEEAGPEASEVELATEVTPQVVETLAPPKYEVLPSLKDRFKSLPIKEAINQTLVEQLSGRTYRADQAPRWSTMIANGIRQRVERLCMNRYKILVTVSVAEMRGAGLTCVLRCIWDPDADSYIYDSFQNNSLYAHATVFGLYLY